MTFYVQAIGFNFVLSVLLFFINGFIGSLLSKYSFFDYEPLLYRDPNSDSAHIGVANFSIKVIHPIIFMAVVATILQGLFQSEALPWIKTLWLLCPFYWFIQYMYARFRNRTELHVKHIECFNFILSLVFFEVVFLLLVLLVSEEGNDVVPYIFIPLDELRNAIWYAIIAFIVKDIWEIFKFHYIQSREIVNERIESVLKKRYFELSAKYGDIVEKCIREVFYIQDNELEKTIYYLLFAIMIYEDYNRSKNVRYLENLWHRFVRREMSVGIMQVRSKISLTDEQSIEKACELLKPKIDRVIIELSEENLNRYNGSILWSFEFKIGEVLKEYNAKKMYSDEVSNLFRFIRRWENTREAVFK